MTAITDHAATIRRILDILQADSGLSRTVKEWRFGELPEQTQAHRYPCVYVTTAMSPQVSRRPMTTAHRNARTGLVAAPNELVTTEYWAVVVSAPGMTPAKAMEQALAIASDITRVMLADQHLQLPVSTSASDAVNAVRVTPYSMYTTVSSQPRLTMMQGRMVQSITVMIRCTTAESHRPTASS